MRAERTESGMIRLTGNAWSDEFSEDRLQGWIAFYDRMFADYGQPTYKATADALRAL